MKGSELGIYMKASLAAPECVEQMHTQAASTQLCISLYIHIYICMYKHIYIYMYVVESPVGSIMTVN